MGAADLFVLAGSRKLAEFLVSFFSTIVSAYVALKLAIWEELTGDWEKKPLALCGRILTITGAMAFYLSLCILLLGIQHPDIFNQNYDSALPSSAARTLLISSKINQTQRSIIVWALVLYSMLMYQYLTGRGKYVSEKREFGISAVLFLVWLFTYSIVGRVGTWLGRKG
jgi:hypothetical protein